MAVIMSVWCVNFRELAALPAMIYRFKDVLVTHNCRLHKPRAN